MFRRHASTGAVAFAISILIAVGASGLHAKTKFNEPGAQEFLELDPANFDHSENIDHPYWPLRPGTEMVFEGTTEDDEGVKTAHRLVSVVTDLTKMVAGVRVRVVMEADYSAGTMIEQELAYFAQDKAGNVWHLGQYRETYEDEFVGGRIFYVGQPEGAKAGIMVPAEMKVGTPSFSQGYGPPPFNWTDRGRIHQIGQKTKVAAGSYDDVLVIEEYDLEHPGESQLKYFARGVGNVRVGWKGEGATRETMELKKVSQLDAQAMDAIRARAMDMEKRASIYCTLPPLEQMPTAE